MRSIVMSVTVGCVQYSIEKQSGKYNQELEVGVYVALQKVGGVVIAQCKSHHLFGQSSIIRGGDPGIRCR
jgi:hypothetical protein